MNDDQKVSIGVSSFASLCIGVLLGIGIGAAIAKNPVPINAISIEDHKKKIKDEYNFGFEVGREDSDRRWRRAHEDDGVFAAQIQQLQNLSLDHEKRLMSHASQLAALQGDVADLYGIERRKEQK